MSSNERHPSQVRALISTRPKASRKKDSWSKIKKDMAAGGNLREFELRLKALPGSKKEKRP